MDGSRLRIRVDDEGPFVRVVLAGEFDIVAVPIVNACLLDLTHASRRVLLDIGGVTFMHSRALALLIGVSKSASEDRWQFGITEPRHEAVTRLFEITEAARLLPMRDGAGVAVSPGLFNAEE